MTGIKLELKKYPLLISFPLTPIFRTTFTNVNMLV